MNELLTLSARQLSARLRAGAVSAVEVVRTHIHRIEQVNPALNALVADRFEAALDEARAADVRLASDPSSPPLLGVPCTIKEVIGVRGMPHTAGIWARRHQQATTDATVVRRLKRAGAIVLGVSNAPEGGLWHETSNPVYGRTHNPHDLWRTPGGSSGGEGALVAAGATPFGLGSDTGGSIRIPAGFCGVAGHKPTGGWVPNTGHYPHAPDTDDPVMVIGPLARSATDLWTLLCILCGPDGIDPLCGRDSGADPDDPDGIDWSEVTVMPLPEVGAMVVRPEVRAAVHRAARLLSERGARIAPYSGPDLSQAFALWSAMLTESGASYAEILRPDATSSIQGELLRWPLGRSHHAGGVLALMGIEAALARLPGSTEALAQSARQLRVDFHVAIGPRTVVVHPVYPRAAPRHRGMVLRDPRDVGCTTAFNLTESPVTVVPVDVDRNGLPIGVQLAGRRGSDALTIAAAVAIEADLGQALPTDPRWGRTSLTGARLA